MSAMFHSYCRLWESVGLWLAVYTSINFHSAIMKAGYSLHVHLVSYVFNVYWAPYKIHEGNETEYSRFQSLQQMHGFKVTHAATV